MSGILAMVTELRRRPVAATSAAALPLTRL
jgi:hypothetical protein